MPRARHPTGQTEARRAKVSSELVTLEVIFNCSLRSFVGPGWCPRGAVADDDRFMQTCSDLVHRRAACGKLAGCF